MPETHRDGMASGVLAFCSNMLQAVSAEGMLAASGDNSAVWHRAEKPVGRSGMASKTGAAKRAERVYIANVIPATHQKHSPRGVATKRLYKCWRLYSGYRSANGSAKSSCSSNGVHMV